VAILLAKSKLAGKRDADALLLGITTPKHRLAPAARGGIPAEIRARSAPPHVPVSEVRREELLLRRSYRLPPAGAPGLRFA